MKLDELRQSVFGSHPDDWHVITCWGGGGPSYLDRFSQVTSYEGGHPQHWLEHDSHGDRATYRGDIRIGLAWGLSRPDDKRTFEWNKNFADADCYPTLADILWNGSLVDRYTGLVVDGGRMSLPFPHAAFDTTHPDKPKVTAEWVTQDEVRLWRLIQGLESNTYNFDEYLGDAGFEIR